MNKFEFKDGELHINGTALPSIVSTALPEQSLVPDRTMSFGTPTQRISLSYTAGFVKRETGESGDEYGRRRRNNDTNKWLNICAVASTLEDMGLERGKDFAIRDSFQAKAKDGKPLLDVEGNPVYKNTCELVINVASQTVVAAPVDHAAVYAEALAKLLKHYQSEGESWAKAVGRINEIKPMLGDEPAAALPLLRENPDYQAAIATADSSSSTGTGDDESQAALSALGGAPG